MSTQEGATIELTTFMENTELKVVSAADDYLIDLLTDLEYVDPKVVELARALISHYPEAGVVETLFKYGLLNEASIVTARAAHFGFEAVFLDGPDLDPAIIIKVPADIARRYRVIPIDWNDSKTLKTLTLAVSDPSNLAELDSLTHLLDVEDIIIRVSPITDICKALDKYYPVPPTAS